MSTVDFTSQLLTGTEILDEGLIVDSWFLTATPWPTLSISAFYLYFVLSAGPTIMEKRKPFNLKYIMIAYNLYQVIYNGWLVLWFATNEKAIPYLLKHSCHPLDPAKNPLRLQLCIASWFYLLSKVIDMADTVFMVLRKKNSHVTFLHLYHHTGMVMYSWITIRYIRGEQGLLIGVINAFVHVIMYSYYLLAAMGPQVQNYLWVKKYITWIQLLQFVFGFGFMAYLVIEQCTVSRIFSYIWMANMVVFICLFANFYYKTYIANSRSPGSPTQRQKAQ